MKTLLPFVLLLSNLFYSSAFAYGSGGSAKACEKPVFSQFQPPPNTTLPSFSTFSFLASPNTDPASINVDISAGAVKQAFKAKDLHITAQKNGSLEVKGQLQNPIDAGFARVNIAAKSRRGCDKADGYLLKLGEK